MSTMSGAFACEICNMVLNCHQQYQQHRAGKKHLAMAKSRGLSYSDNVRAGTVILLSFCHYFSPYYRFVLLYEPHNEKTRFLAYAKTEAQISCVVTAQLISTFVFATQIVQFLFFLNPESQASSLFV